MAEERNCSNCRHMKANNGVCPRFKFKLGQREIICHCLDWKWNT